MGEEMREPPLALVGIHVLGDGPGFRRVHADHVIEDVVVWQLEHFVAELFDRLRVQQDMLVLVVRVGSHRLRERRVFGRGDREVVVDAVRVALAVEVEVQHDRVHGRVRDDVAVHASLQRVDQHHAGSASAPPCQRGGTSVRRTSTAPPATTIASASHW